MDTRPSRDTANGHNIDQSEETRSTSGQSSTTNLGAARLSCDKQPVWVVWWFEISCCFYAVAALATIITILLPYHGQTPLPRLPYHITVNASLAILTTILKICCLVAVNEGISQLKWEHFKLPTQLRCLASYDTASCGPLGCVTLVIALRLRHLLGTAGAILSILFLVTDPFTQQLVKYSFCSLPATNGSVATIPRTSAYWDNIPAHATDSEALRLDQSNAILAGLFSPVKIKVPTSCPTSNCTYDTPYATIAFCASCQDVTSELTYTYSNVPSHGMSVTFYNTSLPSGLSTSTTNEPSDDTALFNMNVVGGALSPHKMVTGTVLGMILGKWSPAPINASIPTGWYAMNWGGVSDVDYCRYDWQNATWGCRGQGAARCTIKPCVQVLQGRVESDVPTEDILQVHTDWFHGTGVNEAYDQMVMADLSCVDDANKTRLQALGLDVSRSRFMPYNVAVSNENDFTQLTTQLDAPKTNDTGVQTLSNEQMSLVPKGCIYQVSGTTVAAMNNFFADTFSRQVSTSISYAQLEGEMQVLRILNGTYANAELIGKLFDNMARSLSMLARQATYFEQAIYSNPAQGVVLVGDTCVIVQWRWIAVPAILTILTVGFLAAVIVRTETSSGDSLARGWKSSLLPLLYHGIGSDENESAGRGQLSDIKSMETAAEKETGSIAFIAGSDDAVKLRN